MAADLVAIVGWRRGARLAENRRLLERAAASGRIRPRGWRGAVRRWRALAVHADGTVELTAWTVRTAARRAAPAPRATRRKDRSR